jgi:hypothetical protein
MWAYFSWLIVLLGAELSFAYQNEKTFAMERLAEGASYAYREALGLWAMIELGRRFDRGEPGLSAESAAKAWNVPARLVNETFRELEEGRLVVQCASRPPTYQPSRFSRQDHGGRCGPMPARIRPRPVGTAQGPRMPHNWSRGCIRGSTRPTPT